MKLSLLHKYFHNNSKFKNHLQHCAHGVVLTISTYRFWDARFNSLQAFHFQQCICTMNELICEGERQDTERGTVEQDRRKSKNSTEKDIFCSNFFQYG